MKIKPDYTLRKVMSVWVVIGVGNAAYTPNRIMTLNETGAFLWDILLKGAGREQLAEALTREYEVDMPTAERDVDVFLAELRSKALIDE